MESKEARQKMCPFQNHPEITINCIAEKCMAWTVEDGGFCELIHGFIGCLRTIADRMPN